MSSGSLCERTVSQYKLRSWQALPPCIAGARLCGSNNLLPAQQLGVFLASARQTAVEGNAAERRIGRGCPVRLSNSQRVPVAICNDAQRCRLCAWEGRLPTKCFDWGQQQGICMAPLFA